MSSENPRIVLAGSVNSSRKTLEKLFEYDMNVVGVLGLDTSAAKNVSGYVDLKNHIQREVVEFNYFTKINSDKTIDFVRDCKPDYFFVIGLSQMVREDLLKIPSKGCVGFHPTKLPEGRGRGAVAWLILGRATGAATFFQMGAGMDDGPILAQVPFSVDDNDYAQDVINKITEKIGECLDGMLPAMRTGKLTTTEQDHSKATYLGKRNPEDGLISWNESAKDIHKLIRAVSDPLPGAYTYYNNKKIIIKRADIEPANKYTGVVGGILRNDSSSNGILVQTGDGLLSITEIVGCDMADIRIGKKLGLNFEKIIANLENELENLKKNNNE